MRTVFIDNLPKKLGIGLNINKQCIDWSNAIGYKIKFIYEDIIGEIEIINHYKKSGHNYLDIKYIDKIISISSDGLIKCALGNLLNRYVRDFKYNIGNIINLKFSDIQILEQIKISNKSGNIMKWYRYKCLKCGNEDNIRENDLSNNKGCNVCCIPSKKILIGYNDLWTTHPHIAKLMKDAQEGYNISSGSDKYNIHICPCCGYEKSYVAHNLIAFGFSCDKCGDGISFCNKVGFNLLEQLGINFTPEYNFYNYRFDFYFELNGDKYDLEMDGALGHGNYNTLTGISGKETEEKDKIRDIFTSEYGIETIRIDCLKSDINYIKQNIISSKFNQLFDLSIIDWNKCEEFANKSLVKTVCDHWNSGIKNTLEISNIMKLSKPTIILYLKRGSSLGICNYNMAKRKVIQLSIDNKFIKEWNGIAQTERELHIKNIGYCCQNRDGYKTAGGFKWVYKEDYDKK